MRAFHPSFRFNKYVNQYMFDRFTALMEQHRAAR